MVDKCLFSLQGKNILITGASSGIGKEIALLCSQMGANVYIAARREEKLCEVLSEMQDGIHKYFIMDLTDDTSITQLVENISALDGIVHCAGIGSRKLSKFITRVDIETLMNINFTGPVVLQSKLIASKKMQKGSSIVFIASYAAESPSIANSIYSATKGALLSYANCLALEVAPRGMRVNCISPGMVWTDLIIKDGIDVELLKEDEKRYPLGRYGSPADISPLAVYLLSDASKWMTTTNIKITGGGELSSK